MKHKKIIFVCTGNTCRSPMAEAALKSELKKRKISWYTVLSAGLSTTDGAPMSEFSQKSLTEAGIPFAPEFKSRQLTPKMIEEAHAIVCMTESHRRALGEYPNVTSIFALCGRDIPDPYGQGIEVYRTTLRNIRECLPKIIQVICPKIETRGESK